MAEYGYARVSSRDQNLDRQIDALKAFPISRKRIYADKSSGANFDRPCYQKLLKRLRSGDTLVITSVDRLGRNYEEIIEQWRNLTHQRGIYIVVLDMPLLDTRPSNDLVRGITGTFLADIVLQLLSYVAQVEREHIRQRQAEGIAAAKARGKQFGRPVKPKPDNFNAIRKQYEMGVLSKTSAAKQLGVCRITFDKWINGE